MAHSRDLYSSYLMKIKIRWKKEFEWLNALNKEKMKCNLLIV
jgi:hypothetical protein